MRNSLSVPIVKPINGACNLCCSYCYMHSILEPQRSNHAVMTTETLRATIDFFCSRQDKIEFTWHGGEPLLVGMEFYREVAKIQETWKSHGKKIVNFIQTNGVFVDDEWAKLFADLDFYVGVSLDAPPNVHNDLRITGTGFGSFEKVIEGISRLKKYDKFNGVICCVGRKNFSKPEEIINFFLEYGIKAIKFLRIRDNQEAISAKQYVDFLIQIFNLWLKIDDPDLEIRDIKSVVNLLLGGEFRECTFIGRCDQFATVYSDGSIFACDRFVNESHFRFGTVFESYLEILERKHFQDFLIMMKKAREPCKSCRWHFLCNGGCLVDQVGTENSDVCKANQKLFEEIETSLKKYGLLV